MATRRCEIIFSLVAMGLSLASNASAQANPDLFSEGGLKTVVSDTGSILTSPSRWTNDEWLEFAVAGGAVGASAALDKTVAIHTLSKKPSSSTKTIQQFGSTYSYGVLALFEGYDLVADDATARAVALDGVSASVIAGGIITPSLKYIVGRYRPRESNQTFKFSAFSHHASFPSGHATQAFAVATVIAYHYDSWWIKGLAYGTALGVDYSRINQHAHYISDVTAGSLIGYFVGRAGRTQERGDEIGAFNLMPFDHEVAGLLGTCSF